MFYANSYYKVYTHICDQIAKHSIDISYLIDIYIYRLLERRGYNVKLKLLKSLQ